MTLGGIKTDINNSVGLGITTNFIYFSTASHGVRQKIWA